MPGEFSVAVAGDTIAGVVIPKLGAGPAGVGASSLTTTSYGKAWILNGDTMPDHPASPFGIGTHSGKKAQAALGQRCKVEGKAAVRDTADPCDCGHIITQVNPGTVAIGV